MTWKMFYCDIQRLVEFMSNDTLTRISYSFLRSSANASRHHPPSPAISIRDGLFARSIRGGFLHSLGNLLNGGGGGGGGGAENNI